MQKIISYSELKVGMVQLMVHGLQYVNSNAKPLTPHSWLLIGYKGRGDICGEKRHKRGSNNMSRLIRNCWGKGTKWSMYIETWA